LGHCVKHSLAKLLSLITGLLVVVLVSVFAIFATTAFRHQQDASRIVSIVGVKHDMLSSQQALRAEGGILDMALEEKGPASQSTLELAAQLHTRTQQNFARLRLHAANKYTSGYAQILELSDAYERMLPAILATAALPLQARSPKIIDQRLHVVSALLDELNHKSASLSRSISSADPLINEMLRVNDIAWRARSDAGTDRHSIMRAMLQGEAPPIRITLRQTAEMNGRVAVSWSVVEDDARLPEFPPELKAAVAKANWIHFTQFMAQRNATLAALLEGKPAPMSVEDWVKLSNHGIAALMAVSNTALDITGRYAAQQAAMARTNFYIAIGLMLASIALASFAALYVIWGVIRPLRGITRTMEQIAGGNLESDIPFDDRSDEIGQFAAALKLFRDGSMERIKLEKALVESRVAQETAETSSRIKSEFLANMSHELRTPLNAIIGFSDIMQHQIRGPLPPDYAEYANLINESGNHLLNLVSDILDLAKIEAGKFSIDPREVNLEETVDYCLRLTQRRAEECGLTLVKTMATGPMMLTADPRACKQILLNLLSNAMKFTRRGGTVEITAISAGDVLRISVRDTGIGIPAQILSRIGEAFQQASNDPMLAREGTGLGLALVKALVSQHGGSVHIESTENVGTIVTVELPRVQSARAAA
jgi:signal transduction histidine kinase